MCGRYGLISKPQALIKRFDVENNEFDFKENYNVAPSLKMPIIERHSPNSVHLREWGALLYNKYFTINARTDKLETNNIWKKAIQERRCIIPADYFFEWKRTEKSKQPYLFRLKNKELMGFAGFLVDYLDKDKKERTGYIMLTTEANSIMEPIHDRIPVILRKEDEDQWLNPDTVEFEHLLKFLKPFPSEEMDAFPVSQVVNSPRNNDKSIINPQI